DKRTNLNAQEIGDDRERAKGWKRFDHNAVFDEDEVRRMVHANIDRLTNMQLTDGGWGWFSGWGEQSYPHTTALVVHGLQIAREAMFGLDLEKQRDQPKLQMVLKNNRQFGVEDNENQTAYLKLPENNFWWFWYGSEIEADAYYLKLLARTAPKGQVASRLVK